MGLFSDCCDEDFFGNPKGGGCFGAALILICSLALAGYGITKGVKTIKRQKTEQIVNTPTNAIVFNNIKTR